MVMLPELGVKLEAEISEDWLAEAAEGVVEKPVNEVGAQVSVGEHGVTGANATPFNVVPAAAVNKVISPDKEIVALNPFESVTLLIVFAAVAPLPDVYHKLVTPPERTAVNPKPLAAALVALPLAVQVPETLEYLKTLPLE